MIYEEQGFIAVQYTFLDVHLSSSLSLSLSFHAPDKMVYVSILTISHVPNLTFFVPDLIGASNVRKIEHSSFWKELYSRNQWIQ